MKSALALVAHPDDCLIFGYHFIKDRTDLRWDICYLTYSNDHPRVEEMRNFWKLKGVDVRALGFEDDWPAVKQNLLGFDQELAANKILEQISQYDLLLTHNHLGEYGHPHHKFINQTISNTDIAKVYFGNYPDYCNYSMEYREAPYDINQFPLHFDVLKNVDIKNYKYFITESAEKIL